MNDYAKHPDIFTKRACNARASAKGHALASSAAEGGIAVVSAVILQSVP